MKVTFATSFLIFFWSLSVSMAQLQVVPPSLAPGARYRLVFVTTSTTDATSSEIDDYNNLAQSNANSIPELAALGAQWRAIASTAAINARDNTQTDPDNIEHTDVPVFLIVDESIDKETMIATGNSDLWDGSIFQPINNHENGATPTNPIAQVWTGTNADGLQSPWPLGELAIAGVGSYTQSAMGWMRIGSNTSSIANPVYAISSVLITPFDESRYASTVTESSEPGQDVNLVLGPPDGLVKDFNDLDGVTPGYVIVEFPDDIIDRPGNDIRIHLVDWDDASEEFILLGSDTGVFGSFYEIGFAGPPTGAAAEPFEVDFDISGIIELAQGFRFLAISNVIIDTTVEFEGADIDAFELLIDGCNPSVLLGDLNNDDQVSLLDVAPFVDALTGGGGFVEEADMNCDGVLDLLDVEPFVETLIAG